MNLDQFEEKVRLLRASRVDRAGLCPLSEAHLSLAQAALEAAIHHLDIAALFQAQALAGSR